MADFIEMPFGVCGYGGPKERCNRWGSDPPTGRANLWGNGRHNVAYRKNVAVAP